LKRMFMPALFVQDGVRCCELEKGQTRDQREYGEGPGRHHESRGLRDMMKCM
jgi:hypothetical protein